MTTRAMTFIQAPRLSENARFATITVDQYHGMIKAGVFPDGTPIELLDGMLVLKDRSAKGADPMSIGEEHRWCVQQLTWVLLPVRQFGCDLQTQQPVVLLADGEPEPDGAIIVDAADKYRARKPVAADVRCAIEVADSSLAHDRTTKYAMYARAGIPQYIILNLDGRAVEVFEEPIVREERYARPTILRPGQDVKFSCGGGQTISVPVDQLLP